MNVLIRFVIIIILMTSFVMVSFAQAEGSPTADFQLGSNKITKAGDYSWIVYVNEPVSFHGGKSTDCTTYDWNFGDGHHEYSEFPTSHHIYNRTSEYLVLLTVEDDEGNSDVKDGIINVVEKPRASLVVRDPDTNTLIDTTRTMIPVGEEIMFDGSSSTGEIKMYYFGYDLDHTFIPQIQNILPKMKITYTEPGNYRIGIKVVDKLGNTSQHRNEEFITLSVGTLPQASDNDFGSTFRIDTFFALIITMGLSIWLMKLIFAKGMEGSNSPFFGNNNGDGIWGNYAVGGFNDQTFIQSQLVDYGTSMTSINPSGRSGSLSSVSEFTQPLTTNDNPPEFTPRSSEDLNSMD